MLLTFQVKSESVSGSVMSDSVTPWMVAHQAPRILEWVAYPFSRGSSWLSDQTWVSCIAGGFFTVWATREALTDLPRSSLKELREEEEEFLD